MALGDLLVTPSRLVSDYSDIRRALLRFRFDKEFAAPNRVPMSAVADLAGLSRQSVHNIAMQEYGGLNPETARRLRHAIDLIIRQGVRWRRKHGAWIGYMPDGSLLPPQPQLPRMGVGRPKPKKNGNDHDHPHL